MLQLLFWLLVLHYYQIYQMIERARSFSKGGANIERVMEIERYKIEKEKLSRILHSQSTKLTNYKDNIKTAVVMQGFNKVPGREKPNSFLLHTVKDAHTTLDYDNKKEVVMRRTAQLPFNRETDERLSHLFTKTKEQFHIPKDEACHKYEQTDNEHIRTAQDLHSDRRTSHSLNFKKQTSRPFDESLRKMSLNIEKDLLLTRSNSMGAISDRNEQTQPKNAFLKLNKVHSFSSYTKRDFLSEKKIKCAPEVSGMDAFKINPQKFKSHWKTVNNPKFQQMAKKHLNRHDRDCPPWYTQLAYNPKDTKKYIKTPLEFQKQTIRKENLVQSGYPIRLAI